MVLVPLSLQPGICKVNSSYASGKPAAYIGGRIATGRFIDGDKVRFVAGYPEKISGWNSLISSGITGIIRVLRSWRDDDGKPRLGIGTESHLYYYDGTNTVDITPLRTISTGTLTDPFTAVSGSATIAVSDTSQNLTNGDWIFLNAASDVGGLTIDGWYIVSSRTSSGYDITSATKATSSTGTGGSTTFKYPRVTLTDPFATTNASKVVTVSHTAHGASTNDYVTFSGASASGGITIDGEYQLTKVDADSYTIKAATAATSTTSSGGGSVSTIYGITMNVLTVSAAVVYGVGVYGTGPYGGSATATPSGSAGWTLAPYGNQLLGAPAGGTIYVYDPAAVGRAHELLNAPTDVLAMFVTPERFVVALGTSSSGLQMAWADQDDYTDWTSLATNTANSGRTLQGGSGFVGGLPVRDGISLIFTDRCVFQMNYSGDNLVYDTPLVGDNAGLISAHAAVAQGEACYWMAGHDFWTWNGTVQMLPSDDIRDYVFRDINTLYVSKCTAGLNRAKKEVWFFYPSGGATENDSYVIYHIDQGCWSVGKLDRTAWTDADLYPFPMGADSDGNVFQHEIGTDAAGVSLKATLEFAPIDISNGTNNVDVFGFIPDFERLSGDIDLTINTKYYPQDANVANGPETLTAASTRVDLRADGKMVGFQLMSDAIGGDFRLSLCRVDIQPSGARR